MTLKFGDKVQVIHGFYVGLTGSVMDERINSPLLENEYYVEGYHVFRNNEMKKFSAWIQAVNLQKVEK